MICRVLLASVAVLSLGCAVGPSYHEPELAPAGTAVGVKPQNDSLRAFFDSLDAAAPDSARTAAARTLTPDSADLAWLAVLRDTALVGLVTAAVHENRDVQTAQARIREFRAQLGVAKSGLYPQVAVNAAASTNQIAIGAFQPTSYDALRFTADLAWELDFWGRTRRGIQAARADVDAEDAAYRATLLTLVSDVSNAYLELLELSQEEAIASRTLQSRRATLALARDRFEQGVISALDVHQFESQVAAPAAALAADCAGFEPSGSTSWPRSWVGCRSPSMARATSPAQSSPSACPTLCLPPCSPAGRTSARPSATMRLRSPASVWRERTASPRSSSPATTAPSPPIPTICSGPTRRSISCRPVSRYHSLPGAGSPIRSAPPGRGRIRRGSSTSRRCCRRFVRRATLWYR
jgi:hypothetical protein